MGQDYGPAQGLMDIRDKAVSGFNRAMSYLPPYKKEQRQDTSGHDDDVARANDAFRRQAEKERAAKTAKRSPAPSRKTKSSGR